MFEDEDIDFVSEEHEEQPPDRREREAVQELRAFFESHREDVFFSRQLEVRYEDDYFHWVTNRALRELRDKGVVLGESRSLTAGGSVNLLWDRRYRFYRRSATRLVKLVEEYADPNVGGAVGLHGELMVLEGFAKCEFVMRGRNTQELDGRVQRV